MSTQKSFHRSFKSQYIAGLQLVQQCFTLWNNFCTFAAKLEPMKFFVIALFTLLGTSSFAQEDSSVVIHDTLDIYVINSTNRLMHIDDGFALEFRDLKTLKEIHSINFSTEQEVDKFFETCFRVLEKDVTVVGELYSINRNKLSKNIVRIHNKEEAYFMLSYDTIEKMQKAYNRLK